MRILAIGDVHGCAIAFDRLLSVVQIQPEDRIVTLGDYVDYGLDSKGVIDRLITLYQTGQLVALRGNHEQMMLNSRHNGKILGWLQMGGKATLSSYSYQFSMKMRLMHPTPNPSPSTERGND